MPWQLLTLIAVATESASVLLQRVLLHNDKSDPTAFVIVNQGLMALLVGVYAIFDNGLTVPDLSKYWLPVAATFILYAVGQIVYAYALQRVEASVFTILLSTSAIWVIVISAFVFGSRLTGEQIVGAALIFLSIGLLAGRTKNLKLDTGVVLGLLTGLIFGLATVAYVFVGRHTDAASWTAITPAATAVLVLMANPRSVGRMKPIFRGRVFLRMLFLGIFFGICNVTLLLAYRSGNPALVAPLEKSSIIITVMLSIIFLNEHSRLRQKILASIVCFVGALLIL